MEKKVLTLIVVLSISLSIIAGPRGGDEKNITVIQGTSTADGKSQVAERLLEECIESLPNPGNIEPIVESQSQYLKEINGDPSKNEFVKIYTASLDINYVIRQKALIVVTTSSVQGQEPVMKVLDKTLTKSMHFTSNAADGDLYAGRSRRQYYFSTQDGAKKDVLQRATAWIKQQSAILCKK